MRTLLPALLLCSIPAVAAPPPPPLAQANVPGGTVIVANDGSVTFGGVATNLAIDGAPPERAWVKQVTIIGEALIEIGAWRKGHGRVMLVRPGAKAEILLDEPIGRNEDGELERHVAFPSDGPHRWQGSPGIARCDIQVPLFAERYDLAKKTWSPLVGPVPKAPNLAASTPRTLPSPRRALRFSSGSLDGRNTRADYLGAPRELDDGDLGATLLLGTGAPITGAFFTAQASRSVDLVAVRVAPVSAPQRLPAALILVGGTPAKPLYRLPLDPRGASFLLPSAARGSCVSFVIDDDGHAPDVALAEIVLYASDDGADSLPAHAQNVASGAEGSEDAARALEEAGAPGAEAALSALPAASPSGRRRLFAVLRAQKALPATTAAPLGKLLETARGDERRTVVELLASLGPPGEAEADRLWTDHSQSAEARGDAIEILARRANAGTAIRLVDAALDPDPAVAKMTTRVVREAARHQPAVTLEALRRISAGDRALGLFAILETGAHALEPEDRVRAGATLVQLGAVEALPFPLAVHVIAALEALEADTSFRAIDGVLAHSNDRTLRLVALESLPNAASAQVLLERGTHDGDARVREVALAKLAHLDGSTNAFLGALDDTWPQVRRATYAGLAARCAGDASIAPQLEARVFDKKKGDPDPAGRAAALAALNRCPTVKPDRIGAALSEKQPTVVRERAAQLLGDRGRSVLPLLAKMLDRTFSHGGLEMPDVAVAILATIGRLGQNAGDRPYEDDILTILRDAAADPFYPTVRIAALSALASGCPDGAHSVFNRADGDPEPAVQRASALARAKCAR